MTDDMVSLVNRLEATSPGHQFLSLEDLANEKRFRKVPIELNQLSPGMWYDWEGERLLMILRGDQVGNGTFTVEEVDRHKKDCFVFDGVMGDGVSKLVSSFDHIRDYRGNPEQFKVSYRKVDHASEILTNAVFLYDGVFYQRKSGIDAVRCDTQESVRLDSLDARVFDTMRRADERSGTMVLDLRGHRSSNLTRARKWQYGATWALVGGIVVGGAAVVAQYLRDDVPVSTDPVVVSLDMRETLESCQKRDRAKDTTIEDLRTSIDDLTRSKADCVASLGRSERALADVTVEYASVTNQHEICRANYADCDAQIRVVYAEGNVLQADVSQLRSERSGVDADLTRVRGEYATCVADKGKLARDLETARGSVAAMQADREVVGDVTSRLNQCVVDLGRVRSEKDGVQGQYNTCITESKKKDGVLATVRAELVSAQKTRDVLKRNEGEQELVMNVLRGSLSAVERERDAVRRQYNSCVDDKDKLVALSAADAKSISEKYAALDKKYAVCNSDVEKLPADIGRLTNANAALRASDVSSKYNECTTQLNAMTASHEQCARERDGARDLRGQIASLQGVVQGKDALLSERQKTIDALKGQLGTMQGRVMSFDGERAGYNSKIDLLNGNVRDLNGTIESLRGDFGSCVAQRDALGVDLGVLRGDYELIARDYVLSRGDYEICVSDLAELQSRPMVVAGAAVPLTPGAVPSAELDSVRDGLLRECYVARDTAKLERDLAMRAQARYEFMKEKLGKQTPYEEDIALVDALLGRWIGQTCGQRDPRCFLTRDGELAFQAHGTTFREASRVLYQAFVGDLKWKDGSLDRELEKKFVELVAVRSKPTSLVNIDAVAPFNYKFYSF